MANIENADERVLEENTGGGGRRRRKGSRVLVVILVCIALLFLLAYLYFRSMTKQDDPSYVDQTDITRQTERVENKGTKTDSEVYRKAFKDEDNERAQKAAEEGRSSVPRLMGSIEKTPPKPEPAPEPEPAPAPEPTPPPAPLPPPAPAYTPPLANKEYEPFDLGAYMRGSYAPGNIVIDNNVAKPVKKEEPAAPIVQTDEAKLTELGISPGTVLYAVMDIGANSDQPGTPIMARIVSGEYAGAKFIGGFRRMDEKLVLQFNKAVVKNRKGKEEVFSITGYAINPEDYSPGIASSVNTHFLERWGGLIASSFLQGFGEAKSRSGSSYYYGNDNNPGQWTNNYDIADEAWIAAGKVGERLAEKFESNFETPPTVTIKPGEPIGILML